jgi:hypothetical protein
VEAPAEFRIKTGTPTPCGENARPPHSLSLFEGVKIADRQCSATDRYPSSLTTARNLSDLCQQFVKTQLRQQLADSLGNSNPVSRNW